MLWYNINDMMEYEIIQVYCQSLLILDFHNISRQQFQKVMEFDVLISHIDFVFYNGGWDVGISLSSSPCDLLLTMLHILEEQRLSPGRTATPGNVAPHIRHLAQPARPENSPNENKHSV